MKPTTRITMTVLTALGVSIVSAACGGSGGQPEEGNAFLSVVGDRNVFLDYGQQVSIAVRYHDGNDEPLAGEITLAIDGDTAGSQLASTSGVTDAQGIVSSSLTAGPSDVLFRITATAEFAEPAEWTISVSEGAKPLPLEIEGKYQMTSTFDLSASLPGSLGSVVTTLSAIGNSPGNWLADQLDLPGFVGTILNSFVTEYAPDLVNTMVAMAGKVSEASSKFGTVTTLDIKKGAKPGEALATLTLTGFSFKIGGQDVALKITDMGATEPVVADVALTLDSADTLTIAEHDMPIPYGAFLAMAVEDVIIPAIAPGYNTMLGLLQSKIDCFKVGQRVFNALGFGSVTLYQNACNTGLAAGAEAVISELATIDQRAPLILRVSGSAKAKDADSDRRADEITAGKWTGLLDYDGSQGTLADSGNVFEAARMR